MNEYVLITAARNEEAYIRKTLESVVNQTQLPKAWIVVSDGSTDRTEDIVREFASRHSFIRLLRLDNSTQRSFSSKVFALNAGYANVKHVEFDFISFLDADISLPNDYYQQLIARFAMNSRLGLAGGAIVEQCEGQWRLRDTDRLMDVSGQMQFKRACYEDVGGFLPLRWGGEDTVANLIARQKGWQVQVFPDLCVRHLRHTGVAAASRLLARFRDGTQDYFMGYHPMFEVAKCIRRVIERPYVIASVLRFCGYMWPCLTRQRPAMPVDFIGHLRRGQIARLLGGGGGGCGSIRRIDPVFRTLERFIKLLVSLFFFAACWIREVARRLLGHASRPNVVILYYHAIPSGQRLNFARQMDMLLRWVTPIEVGFQSIPPKGARFAGVTFDDGLRSFAENALPQLEKMNIPAALFVVVGKVGCYPDWSERLRAETRQPLLSAEELRELPESIKIGSHTLTHPVLTGAGENEARQQLLESRIRLQKILGRAVTLFSFPKGAFNDELIEWARQAGYERVFTTLPKLAFSDEFVMGRVPADPTDWRLEFLLKLLGAYRWLPPAFTLKRKVGAFLRERGFMRRLLPAKGGMFP